MRSPHHFKLVPAGQAMAQPFPQKHIQLRFFVRLMHIGVGIRIDPPEAAGMFGADDFGHPGVVIDLYFQAGDWKPGQAVSRKGFSGDLWR